MKEFEKRDNLNNARLFFGEHLLLPSYFSDDIAKYRHLNHKNTEFLIVEVPYTSIYFSNDERKEIRQQFEHYRKMKPPEWDLEGMQRLVPPEAFEELRINQENLQKNGYPPQDTARMPMFILEYSDGSGFYGSFEFFQTSKGTITSRYLWECVNYFTYVNHRNCKDFKSIPKEIVKEIENFLQERGLVIYGK